MAILGIHGSGAGHNVRYLSVTVRTTGIHCTVLRKIGHLVTLIIRYIDNASSLCGLSLFCCVFIKPAVMANSF